MGAKEEKENEDEEEEQQPPSVGALLGETLRVALASILLDLSQVLTSISIVTHRLVACSCIR